MPGQAVELLSYLTPREGQVASMMATARTLTELKDIAQLAGDVRTEVVVGEKLIAKIAEVYLLVGSPALN